MRVKLGRYACLRQLSHELPAMDGAIHHEINRLTFLLEGAVCQSSSTVFLNDIRTEHASPRVYQVMSRAYFFV